MANARDYVVSARASDMRDYTTVQACVNAAVAGDRCLVEAGSYPERIATHAAGTAAAPIVIEARGEVVTQGFDLRHAFVTLDGFTIRNEDNHDCTNRWRGGIVIAADDVVVRNNLVEDIWAAAGIDSWESGNAYTPHRVRVEHNHVRRAQTALRISGFAWHVSDNELERPTLHCDSNDADYVRFFGEDHVIERNYLHGAVRSELGDAHTDCFQTYASAAVETGARNVLISRNVCLDAMQGLMVEGETFDRTERILVRGNVFARGLATEMSYTINLYDAPGSEVTHNTLHRSASGGIALIHEAATGELRGRIANNVIARFPGRDAYKAVDASSFADYNVVFDANLPEMAAHDRIVDPQLVNEADVIGPDGEPFTEDDGLALRGTSPACTAGEGGAHAGAYSCGHAAEDAGTVAVDAAVHADAGHARDDAGDGAPDAGARASGASGGCSCSVARGATPQGDDAQQGAWLLAGLLFAASTWRWRRKPT